MLLPNIIYTLLSCPWIPGWCDAINDYLIIQRGLWSYTKPDNFGKTSIYNLPLHHRSKSFKITRSDDLGYTHVTKLPYLAYIIANWFWRDWRCHFATLRTASTQLNSTPLHNNCDRWLHSLPRLHVLASQVFGPDGLAHLWGAKRVSNNISSLQLSLVLT